MMRRDEPATMMHLIRPLLLLLGVIVLLLAAESAAGDSVRVHDVSGSDGPDIVLSQVAELEGDYAASFAGVVVGRFEDGESALTVQTSAILQAMRDQGAKLGRLNLSGFGRCTVHRTFTQPVRAEADASEPAVTNIEAATHGGVDIHTPTTVRALIESRVVGALGIDRASLEFTFSERDEALLRQSAVAGRYEAEPVAEPGLGAVSFKVYAYRGTQRVDDGVTVSATVRRRVIAVIAGEAIQRGAEIGRRQVRLSEVLIEDELQPYLTDTSLVTGQVAARTLRPGQLITAGEVQMPIAVGRRQRVSVELQSPGVKITFNGIAQDEGAIGETIEIVNPQTGEAFVATIVGRAKVVAGPTNPTNRNEDEGTER